MSMPPRQDADWMRNNGNGPLYACSLWPSCEACSAMILGHPPCLMPASVPFPIATKVITLCVVVYIPTMVHNASFNGDDTPFYLTGTAHNASRYFSAYFISHNKFVLKIEYSVRKQYPLSQVSPSVPGWLLRIPCSEGSFVECYGYVESFAQTP